LMLVALLSMTAGAWAQTPGVKPLTVPNEWNGNQSENLYINHLPKDFVATTEERAEALSCPHPDPDVETVMLIYGFDESDFMTVVEFRYGEYYDDYGIQYTLGDMFNQSQNGIKWYYTTEPSIDITPVTGQQNQWTFQMPDADVELTPIYAPEFTATFKAGNDLTIQGGKATLAVTEKDGTTAYTGATFDENGNYKPLYEEQKITLTAKPGYKFKSVEVKKGPAIKTITIEDVVLVYEDGDTWEKIKDRNPGKVECNTYVFIKGRVLLLNGPVSQTAVIVPDGTYTLGFS